MWTSASVERGFAVDEDGEVMPDAALVIEQVGSKSGVSGEDVVQNGAQGAGRGGCAGDVKVALEVGCEGDGDHGRGRRLGG
jgi:hypothetical protein